MQLSFCNRGLRNQSIGCLAGAYSSTISQPYSVRTSCLPSNSSPTPAPTTPPPTEPQISPSTPQFTVSTTALAIHRRAGQDDDPYTPATEYVEIPHKPLIGSMFNSTSPSAYFTTSRPTPPNQKEAIPEYI